MELKNTKNSEFILRGTQILQAKKEVLILVRYPYQAGNKDFHIIRDVINFKKFLIERTPKESITIFKEFETIKKGVITSEFIEDVQKNVNQPKGSDWIVYIEDFENTDIQWSWIENKDKLLELLEEDKGKFVTIIEDLDYFDEELILHAYVQDEDGKIRPGAY